MGKLTWLFHFLLCFSQYQIAFSSSSPSSFSSSSSSSSSPHPWPLCRHDQRSALLQFKHTFTINGSASSECVTSYPKTLSWDENATDCCNWDGVMCDGLTGHVIGLDLSCSQLYGTIHPNSSLFQLSHLQRLNLAHNHFNRSRISYGFGSFANLTHLNLSDSAFSGSISSEISHLFKLISLDLSDLGLRLEFLHFEILLKNLTRLQELVLRDVNISSNLPDSVSNLTSLTFLDLSDTGLQGNLPDSVFHLPNLQRLFLSDNHDLDVNLPKSIPSEISHLSKLISLDLSYSLSRLEPLHFEILLKNLTRLQELVLHGVNISSNLPDSVSNLTSLTFLDLSETGLQGNLPDSVFHLPNLQRLFLSGNHDLDVNLPKSTWRSCNSLRELDLSDTKLSGELPYSIGYLKSLNSLILSNCKLWGPIPHSLGNLTQLHKLDLQHNSFNGEVPSTLSNLKQLTFLRLYFNNLGGRIPDVSAELTMLKTFDLGANNFIGGFPLWVAKLKPLVNLYIDSNQLTGPLPLNLSGLQNLQVLYLSNNSLSGVIPPWLFTLVNLTVLSLQSTNLSGVVDLQGLKNLQYLTLSNTNLSVIARSNVNDTFPNLKHFYMSSCNVEVFPGFLRTSENLERLDLSNNRIHGQIPNWVMFIGKYSLQYLNLSHNFLTNIKQLPWEHLDTLDLRFNLLQGPLPIPPPSILYFFISNNSLSGEIPSLICNASSLEILDFSHNKFSGAVPQCLGNFSSFLSVLNLRSNRFEGTLPLVFAKRNSLRSLDLNGNQFEGPLPRSLTSCRSLEVLNVENNKINDTFPYWLGSLPELQVLVVRSNRFHGPLTTLTGKFSFPKLRIVDLSYNEFTGHLPGRYFKGFQAMQNNIRPDKQYMSDASSYYHDSVQVTMKGIEIELVRILTIFTTIDFSSNNFSGEIPNVVGKLNSLILLNFSHNYLTGHIPASLGDLTNLESLDISSNQLTGRIPGQLTSLTFLEFLNLSSNRLYGPIPPGSQFNTFEKGSYAGNLGLCGFPLSEECEDNSTKVHPPVLQQQEDDPDFDGFTWKIVVMGYGCGMTVGLFLGYLMFLIGRPKFFVRLAEREMPKKVTRLRRMVTDIAGRRK